MEKPLGVENIQIKEKAVEDDKMVEDLGNIEVELAEYLKYLLVRPVKGRYEWTGMGLEDKDMERPKGAERANILKEVRGVLIGKYPSLSEFITALTEAFQPGVEWSQLTTHLLLVNRDRPLVIKKFWNILKNLHALGGSFQSAKRGVIAQSAALQILESLGYSVRTASPKEDMSSEEKLGADLFIEDLPVQVKSTQDKKRGFLVKKKEGGITLYLSGEGLDQFTGLPSRKIIEEASEELTSRDINLKK